MMMSNALFVLTLGAFLMVVLTWGFMTLPQERWQIMATLPRKKDRWGQWVGVNLTYYGVLTASAGTLAILAFLMLMASINVPRGASLLAVALVLACCLPAAKLVARAVEGKPHTSSVAAAAFAGMLIVPLVVWLMNTLAGAEVSRLPIAPTIAAIAIAYILGEGLGRLACISFGCCYGKPLKECSPFLQRLFARSAFIFLGATKKAVYEGQLAGEPLIPIQAITSILYCLTATVASFLFLRGHFLAALNLSITVSQLWRIFSETLRADFRGFTRISAYQKMGGVAVMYILIIALFIPAPLAVPVVGLGLGLLWHPGLLISLQLSWLLFFVIFGRSTVTRSTLSFQLVQESL